MSAATSQGAMTADLSDRDEPWPPTQHAVHPASDRPHVNRDNYFSDSVSSTASSSRGGIFVDWPSDEESQQQRQQQRHQQQQHEQEMMLEVRSPITTTTSKKTATVTPERDGAHYYQATISTNKNEATRVDEDGGPRSVAMQEGVKAGSGSRRRSFWASVAESLGGILRPIRCEFRTPSRGDMLIYGGFLLNLTTKGTIACFETLGAEYAITRFGLTPAEAGSVFATFGGVGVCVLLSMRVLCRYWNDVQLVLGGVSLMVLTCLIFVTSPAGAAGLHAFQFAVFLIYSIGYPIGHTAVRRTGLQT